MSEPDRTYHFDRPLQVGLALSDGWALFRNNLGLLVGVAALAMGGLFLVTFVLGFIKGLLTIPLMGAVSPTALVVINASVDQLVISPVSWVLMGLLFYPMYRLVLRLQDGEPMEFGKVYQPGSSMFRFVLASLLENFLRNLPTMLLAIPSMLVMQAAQAANPRNPLMLLAAAAPFTLATIIIVLGVIPFFIAFPFLVVDCPKVGIFQCLGMSFRAGTKNYFRLMGLGFVAYLVMGLGVLACLVGMLFTVPLGFCYLGAGYRQLVHGVNVDRGLAQQQEWEQADRSQEDAFQDDGSWDQGR